MLFLTACTSKVEVSPEEEARRDSAALHVALMPVADCLPFYVAQRTGIYERLGLDLRIHTLWAQLDTDTALLRRRVHLAYSDLARAIMLQQADSFSIRAIAATDGEWQLISARRGRVRTLAGLKERMVAVARHSATDYWSDRFMDSARMARTDIFRPQINDVRIRTDMLCNGTMDAALLPLPYAIEARLRGANQNATTRGTGPSLAALLAPTDLLADSSRVQQLRLLFQGYEQARQLRDSLPTLLHQLCLVPDTLADTLARALPVPAPLTAPDAASADAALQWLRSRGQVRKNYSADTLIREFHGLQSLP